jgi:hypothetical protein
MIAKASISDFFTKGKVIFATIAAVITFSITLYNQFKGNKTTEISGIVCTDKNGAAPVDATVSISSPVLSQTETDNRGHFRFMLPNLQTDTFLLIVTNKRTHTVTKQNEYVNASNGRKDILVVFDSSMRDGQTYTTHDTAHLHRRMPNLGKIFQRLIH